MTVPLKEPEDPVTCAWTMVVDFEIRSFRLSSSREAPQTGASQTARQSAPRTGFSTTCHGALRIPIQLIENKSLTVRYDRRLCCLDTSSWRYVPASAKSGFWRTRADLEVCPTIF